VNSVEDNVNDKDWELLKEALKQRIAEVDERAGLADQQRAIIKETILEPLEATGEPSEISFLYFLGCAMAGWIEVGLLPSEWEATADRINSRLRANDELVAIGEWQFWQGLYFEETENWSEAKSSFDLAVKDASLPRGIRLASLYLRVWCHVASGEYDEARKVLTELRNAVSTFANKWHVDHMDGYIWALQRHGITEACPPVTLALDINGEITSYEERVEAGSLAEGVSLPESTVKALKLAMTEIIEPRLRLALWQAKEEIIRSMPITHTLEEASQRLRSEHGDWVSKLANQGALVNAEFLYRALKAKSWGGVITEYANSVEAEIKAKLLPRLDNLLKKKGTTLENLLPSRVESGGSSLGYAEIVLKRIATNPLLKNLLLSALPEDTCSFLLSELPGSLARLRQLRKPPAHGDVMTASEAKEMRRLVLGTPEKPGLLKRLNETDIPYAG
jgi:hypothetical protein